MNARKTECLTTGAETSGSIQTEGTELPRTKALQYLETAGGSTEHETTPRTNAG